VRLPPLKLAECLVKRLRRSIETTAEPEAAWGNRARRLKFPQWHVCELFALLLVGLVVVFLWSWLSGSGLAAEGQGTPLRKNMCGPIALWFAARCHGMNPELERLAYLANTDPVEGTSLADMVGAARAIGMFAEVVEADLKGLIEQPRVAILLLNSGQHYVVLDDVSDEGVYVLDGPRRRLLAREELDSVWGGYAILVGEGRGEAEGKSLGLRELLLVTAAGFLVAGAIVGLVGLFRRVGLKGHG